MGIAKPKLALKDFKILAMKQPLNKDVFTKLAECEKIVKRIQFEKAIESDSPPSAWEGINVEDLRMSSSGEGGNVDIEDGYDGVKLGPEMTWEFIQDMIQRFKENKRIHKNYVSPPLDGAS
jgi:serine/threonine-protein phosphatase 5